MRNITNTRTGFGLALFASLLTWLVLVGGALGAPGGNAINAKLCQKGGWSTLMDSSTQQFANEDACVSYAAHGGAIYALATIYVEPCATQPYDGICAATSGSGLKPGSAAITTLYKNGSSVLEDFPIVQSDGTVSSSPISHFEIPCVAGNLYAAKASGTSADSLSLPVAPGIPVASNTVERTSACP
jgi:hypothetical protein